MALIPLQIPPGVYRNGTDLQAEGRWHDAHLVRWGSGVMQPMGGWRLFSTSLIGKPVRGSMAWRDNAGNKNIAAGTYNSLHYVSAGGVVSDITPTGLTSGAASGSVNTGFGGYTYGTSLYGVRRPDDGTAAILPTVWSMDTFGQYLVALSPADGKVNLWTLNTAVKAAPITGAPTGKAIVVTEERFLMVLGANGDARTVAWCDQGDYTVWTAAATNQAGDLTLQTSGELLRGLRVPNQTLIFTTADVYAATYIGPPYIYGFEKVGEGCAPIAPDAVTNTPDGAMWMTDYGFYRYTGGAITPVACDVSDYVFSRLNRAQAGMVTATHMPDWHEVWFFYPNGTENDSYVVYNYLENHWTIGNLGRSAPVVGHVFESPLWWGSNGALWEHEIGTTYTGADAPSAESGPIQLGVGEQTMIVTGMIPDEKTQGDVQAYFRTQFYPNGDETLRGPYQMANPTSLRFSARQVSMLVNSNPDQMADWRLGLPRLELQVGGKR